MKRYILFFVFFVAIFYFPQLFLGETFGCCDNLNLNVPSKIFLVNELKQWHLPLWNPNLFTGMPYLADLNLNIFYPLNILYFLFPVFRALVYSIVISILGAGLGVFALSCSFGQNKRAALVSAMVFSFSGTLSMYTNNDALLRGAWIMPWMIWSWRIFAKNDELKYLLLASGITALQILSGHPQISFYSFLLSVVVYWHSCNRSLLKIVNIFWISGIATALSAIQLLPTLELTMLSTRLARSFDYSTSGSLPLHGVVRFIFPAFLGSLAKGTAWMQGGNISGFVGLIPLLLAFFGVFNRRSLFWLLITFFSLVLSFGKNTPVFGLAYHLIPGLSLFRTPEHFLLIFTLSFSMLAGMGFNSFVNKSKLVGFLFVFAGFSWVVIGWITKFFPWNIVTKLTEFSPSSLKSLSELMTSIFLLQSIIFLLLGASLYFFKKHFGLKQIIVVCAIFLELFIVSRHALVSIPEQNIEKWQSENIFSSFLKNRNEWDSYRVYVDALAYYKPESWNNGGINHAIETKWQAQVLRNNLTIMYGIPTIDGYASLVPISYSRFWSDENTNPTGVKLPALNDSRISLVGAKYILTKKEVVLNESYRKISNNNELSLYENNSVTPRFFLESNGIKEWENIRILNYQTNKVELEIESKNSAKLVFVDLVYPGWEAVVDGHKRSIEPYLGTFKSFSVSPGKHRVDFLFKPMSVIIGGVISLVTLIAILILTIFLIIKSRKQKL